MKIIMRCNKTRICTLYRIFNRNQNGSYTTRWYLCIGVSAKILSYSGNLTITYYGSIMYRIRKNKAFQAVLLYLMEKSHVKEECYPNCFSIDKVYNNSCRQEIFHNFTNIFIHQKADFWLKGHTLLKKTCNLLCKPW